jgi:rhodanese-related sulfurtransferase
MFGLGGPKVINMTPAEVKAGLDKGDVILIDVREPDEYRSERIAGAINHPLSRLDPNALPLTSGKTVVLHCAAGGRSARAVTACKANGVDVTRHLAGGIGAWKAAGLPTVR